MTASPPERVPVATVAELATLDEAKVLAGYLDGFNGDPEPGDNRSKAYWHGWRNGTHDRTGKSDAAVQRLAREVVDTGFLRRLKGAPSYCQGR